MTLRHRDVKDEPARPFHPVADLDRDRGWIPEGEAPETDPFGV